jgi:hypothetical protein
MAKKEKPFTVKQGLKIQSENLVYWKKLLKKKHFNTLKSIVEDTNNMNEYRDGYDVFRGADISTALQDIKTYSPPKTK